MLEAFNRTAVFTAPGTLNAEPVAVMYNLPVRFHRKDNPWATSSSSNERQHQTQVKFLEAD
jgi:TPP-dependent pyruvate/acetoin dehydrogenase alpha subunit